MVQQKLSRKSGWRGRLSRALTLLTSVPFEWRKNDCVSGLACTVVEALTGTDLRQNWPKYSSPKSATQALRQRGFSSLEEAVAFLLPEISRLEAQVGDLALLKTSGGIGYALGMVNTSTILVLTEKGLGHSSWDDVVKVFRVGEYEEAFTL